MTGFFNLKKIDNDFSYEFNLHHKVNKSIYRYFFKKIEEMNLDSVFIKLL